MCDFDGTGLLELEELLLDGAGVINAFPHLERCVHREGELFPCGEDFQIAGLLIISG